MNSSIRWTTRRLGHVMACGALLAFFLGSSLAPAAATAKSCDPVRNVEGIVDDSISMTTTDPDRLRVQAIDFLMATLRPSTDLGIVEFGSEGPDGKPAADSLFPPEPIGPNEPAMQAALAANVNADNYKTDYNAAFAAADAANPTSQARIFLTDGGHDVGAYTEAHLAHPVPTYVVGFGLAQASPEDKARLEKIASDTGGVYLPIKDVAELQAAMNTIGTTLSCQESLAESTGRFGSGQRTVDHIRVRSRTKAVRIALSWTSPEDRFTLSEFKLMRHHRVAAQAVPGPVRRRNGRPRVLKVVQKNGATFVIAKVSNLSPGVLFFTVTADQVQSAPKVKVVRQTAALKNR